MCVNYITVSRELAFEWFKTPVDTDEDWRDELYQDYRGPIILPGANGARHGLLASYGLIPQPKLRAGLKLTTMNARSETVGSALNYKRPWAASQLCLVPMMAFFEPNWEQGTHVRYRIGMANDDPFAVAGVYQSYQEEDGTLTYAFTQLTMNADEHPLMKRFHRPGDEKRSLIVVRPEDYDDWLSCSDPERARSFFQLYPADRMRAEPAPKITQPKAPRPVDDKVRAPARAAAEAAEPAQASLFD